MQVINRALTRLREHLGMDIAYISELSGPDMIVRAHCAPNLATPLPDQFTLPREIGFCHHMVEGNIPMILRDTSQHPVAAALPTRTEFAVEAYIGLPLEREDGSVYGTLCCLSHKPNPTLNERDLQTVKLFAEIVAGQIDKEIEDQRVSAERTNRIQAVFDKKLLRSKFQPVISLSDGSLKGFEALARFDTELYAPPDTWFATAAQIGRDVELELKAIECAIAGAQRLPDHLTIGLNLSPECLMAEGLDDLLFNVSPQRFVLELTEHAQVENYETLAARLIRLKQSGFRLAVDDAGAGYSSLTHIVQLQPDIIKLDMALTRGIHEDQVRRSLANAMVFFAKETNAVIVAEGVETEGEKDTLAALGVDFGQGYFFDRPLEIDEACARAAREEAKRSAA